MKKKKEKKKKKEMPKRFLDFIYYQYFYYLFDLKRLPHCTASRLNSYEVFCLVGH